jgi:hypothetical protein
MPKEPVYTKFWAKDGRIHAKNVYEDSPEYWLPYLVITLLFIVALVVSGYFFFRQPFEDRPEYLVGPFTLFVALLVNRNGNTAIFMPAFVVGCIWGVVSIFTDINFNLPAYVFCYCSALLLMFIIVLLKNR